MLYTAKSEKQTWHFLKNLKIEKDFFDRNCL